MDKGLLEVELLISAYRDMLLLRRFEEKAAQLYGMGQIAGFCHLYTGQEAVAVGIVKALKKGDSIITSYRDHGPMLALGSNPDAVMAELMGREGGCSKGKGGSMHMFDIERGFFGGHGIVGAQVPIGTGVAFAFKYLDEDNISVTMMGDGAANQGQVYESFNMAKLWGLPVLYVIENNEYGMGTSVARASCTKDLYTRGKSFDIQGKKVNGMDFVEVYQEVLQAVEYVRSEKMPALLEMKTYRYRGHSMSDPAKYRPKEEVENYKNADSIELLKGQLVMRGMLDDTKVKLIETDVKNIVQASVNFAQNSKEPNLSTLLQDVYI